MNVTELFRRLSYAELSNIALGLEGAGSIKEERQSALVHYTNEALLRLFSKFVLKENDLILECVEHITDYKLLKRYARTYNGDNPPNHRYIQDHSREPFQEDVLKIIGAYDRYSEPYLINDSESVFSLFTPQPSVLQVPRPVAGEPIAVIYQARHPLLPYEDLTVEIDLPVVLEGALTAHIAHQVYGFMNGQENKAKSDSYFLSYERICAGVTEHDLVNSSHSQTNSKFNQRGFS